MQLNRQTDRRPQLSLCLTTTMRAHNKLTVFSPHEAMHKRGLCRRAVFVRPSVCLSRSCTLSKRINISSKFFFTMSTYTYIPVIPCRMSWQYTETTSRKRWKQVGHWGIKNRYFRPVSRCIAGCQCCNRNVCWWRETTTKVCMTRSLNVTPKTTEQHLIVRSDNSEAEVTKTCARGTVLLKQTSDRHETSRGLSATTELRVLQP